MSWNPRDHRDDSEGGPLFGCLIAVPATGLVLAFFVVLLEILR